MYIDSAELTSSNDILTWGEVKAYLRIRVNNDEALLMDEMRSAVLRIEERTNTILVKRSFTVYFDGENLCNYNRQVIPVNPVDLTVTPTLEYFSGVTNGVRDWTAYTDFYVEEGSPAALRFTESASIPENHYDGHEVEGWRMTLTAGPTTVSQRLKTAVLVLMDIDYNELIDGERIITNLLKGVTLHGNSF
jgi:uncharacterized phiE125 gp8 family phage protein